jgi:hypothetical protein
VPELEDGAVEVLSPVDPPELDPLELDPLELEPLDDVPDEAERDDEPELCVLLAACRVTVAAWVEPGRVRAMPAAATTPVTPAAAVTRRSRRWLRFLAVTAACRTSSRELRGVPLAVVIVASSGRRCRLLPAWPEIFSIPSERASGPPQVVLGITAYPRDPARGRMACDETGVLWIMPKFAPSLWISLWTGGGNQLCTGDKQRMSCG